MHIYKLNCELIQNYEELLRKKQNIYERLNKLLGDINKYWIVGNTYSAKIGDISELISINHTNKKPFDKVIYQGYLNDNSYSIDCTLEISDSEIQSLCFFKKLGFLLITDNEGSLHIFDYKINQRIGKKIEIKNHQKKIYSKNLIKQNSLEENDELEKNYIRRVFILPNEEWGVFLLRNGGVWAFPIDKNNITKMETANVTRNNLDKIFFENDECRLIREDLFAYSIKLNPYNNKVYISDRYGQIYELELSDGKPEDFKKIYEVTITTDYNPVWDFDFFENNGNIIFGNRAGKVVVIGPDNTEEPIIDSFPTSPFFTHCCVLDENIAIMGTEEGNIVCLDYSYRKNQSDNNIIREIHCNWTYNLPGPIRFIEKIKNEKIFIGGLCSKAIIINKDGRIDNTIEFQSRTINKKSYKPLFNRIISADLDVEESEKRFRFFSGGINGILSLYSLYPSKIYEDQVKQFFKDNRSITSKIMMRNIDIKENSLRRLFTENESKMWDFNELIKEVNRIIKVQNFHYHFGSMESLLPNLILKFIESIKNSDGTESEELYRKFQNTITLLIIYWGIKDSPYCQRIMKTLGVGLFKILLDDQLFEKIERIVYSKKIINVRNIQEMLEAIHVQMIPSTLIDMYEDIRKDFKSYKNENTNSEYALDYICKYFRGRKFDKILPDPLLQKKVEVLGDMVNEIGICPIKLCYKLFEYDADTFIFHHLIHKIENENNKEVVRTIFFLDQNLQKHDSIVNELEGLNKFENLFPEKFKENDNGFYTEFSFIFNRIQKIMSFSDSWSIAKSEEFQRYENEGGSFKDTIKWLNGIIDTLSKMKYIFENYLVVGSKDVIPRKEILHLRRYFKRVLKVFISPSEQEKMGRIFSYLSLIVIENLDKILNHFCELTLPLLIIENTAELLNQHLDRVRIEHGVLPDLDSPSTMSLYNLFLRNIFDVLIIGLQPETGLFKYREIQNFRPVDVYDAYDSRNKTIKNNISKNQINSLRQTEKSTQFTIYLLEEGNHFSYYQLGFSEKKLQSPYMNSILNRFKGFVSILNLEFRAFNGMTEAENQGRLSHQLFAHQSKEPILTMKKQLELMIDDEVFYDPYGNVAKDYHNRMLRHCKQILNRSENLLNAFKEAFTSEIIPTEFYLYEIVDDVAKNMRKVMDSRHYKGNITVNKHQNEDILVSTDDNKVREILEQLLGNSIKYSKGIRIISIDIGYDSQNFYLSVEDNGIGIPVAEQPYIFTRFYRGAYARENNIDGDGVGLWATKKNVELLSGVIHFSSQEENGCSFDVKVPRNYKIIKIGEEE